MNHEQINKVIEHVEGGVCASLEDVVLDVLGLEYDELEIEDWADLEAEVFTCAVCGWTVPTDIRSDIEDELVCTRCADEETENYSMRD